MDWRITMHANVFFWQFSRSNIYVSIPGKLSEVHLHACLFSNQCGKVLTIVGISWSPNLRVQYMQDITHCFFWKLYIVATLHFFGGCDEFFLVFNTFSFSQKRFSTYFLLQFLWQFTHFSKEKNLFWHMIC